jgi:arylsulfatase A-like enzyme
MSSAVEITPPLRPNIVVILADDMGVGDIRAYNDNCKVPTPNLDRLAEQGVRMNDAHSPSAVCTPTRYGLLTGRYCWRTRVKAWVLDGEGRDLIEGQQTAAGMLRESGYQTACVGKWHLGLGEFDAAEPGKKAVFSPDSRAQHTAGPHTAGFDYSYIIPASLDFEPYVYLENGQQTEPLSSRTEGSKHRRQGGGGFWRAGRATPEFDFYDVLPNFTRRSADWVRAAGKKGDPFFLYMPLNAPHTPWMPTEDFQGASDAGFYGDFVAQVDHTVGEIMRAVEEAGQTDNTLFIFTSDNGSHWLTSEIEELNHDAHLGRRGMKADIHEGGHRVPFIARWPGEIPAGESSEALVGLNDLFATFAEIIGHRSSDTEGPDSVSFLTSLRAPTNTGSRDHLIHHSGDGMFAIRMGRFKLIEGLGSGGFTNPKRPKAKEGEPPYQLYNLASDPAEEINLAARRPELVEQMLAKLRETQNASS